MAKLNKVLAIYDRQGNRQAIPLYSSLEDVNNLGRKIYYSPTEFAYYPLTEKLDDPNASKKVIVIGTKTYKALLKVGTVGFRTILEALDSNGYLSAENSNKLGEIDRSVGGRVKIHADQDLIGYNFDDMHSKDTIIELDDYSKNKYTSTIDLNSYLDNYAIQYLIPANVIMEGNPKSVAVANLQEEPEIYGSFNGSMIYNTYNTAKFKGLYTDDSIMTIIKNTAGSPLSTHESVDSFNKPNIHSNKLSKAPDGSFADDNYVTLGEYENIGDIDNWNLAIFHTVNNNDNTNKLVTNMIPTSEIADQKSFKTDSISLFSKNDIKNDPKVKNNKNKFKDITVTFTSAIRFYNYGFKINVSIRDTTDAIIIDKSFLLIARTKQSSDYTNYIRNKYPEYKNITKTYIFDNNTTSFIKLIFGNELLHVIDFEFREKEDNRYITTNILNVDGTIHTENFIIRYDKTPKLKINIKNLENTRREVSDTKKSIIGNERALLFATNAATNDIDKKAKLLYLDIMASIMNRKDYTGSKSCKFGIIKVNSEPSLDDLNTLSNNITANKKDYEFYPIKLNEL